MKAGHTAQTETLLQPAWVQSVPQRDKVPPCPILLSPERTTTKSSAFICKDLPQYTLQGYFYINGIMQYIVLSSHLHSIPLHGWNNLFHGPPLINIQIVPNRSILEVIL